MDIINIVKSFLGSTAGLFVALGLVVLVILLVVVVVLLARKAHKASKRVNEEKANMGAILAEKEELRNSNVELQDKVNELTDENVKVLDTCKDLKVQLAQSQLHAEKSDAELSNVREELARLAAPKEKPVKEKVVKTDVEEKPAPVKKKKYTKKQLEGLTKHELMTLCKTEGYDGFYHKSKEEVINHILEFQSSKKKAKK